MREDMQYWAGLFGAVCAAVAALSVVPPPYDTILLTGSAIASTIATYHMTPPRLRGPKDPE